MRQELLFDTEKEATDYLKKSIKNRLIREDCYSVSIDENGKYKINEKTNNRHAR